MNEILNLDPGSRAVRVFHTNRHVLRRLSGMTAAMLLLVTSGLMSPLGAQAETLPVPENLVLSQAIYWNKTPMTLTLRVGAERLVHFPKRGQVKVGVPEQLDETILRTQILDNTVYWLAKQPFESERIQVMNIATGEIFLFDLSAKPEGDVTPVEIVATASEIPPNPPFSKGGIDYVSLTRFAAEQMYAPKRLLRDTSGMIRVPVPNEPVPLVRGGRIEALPLISWRGGEHYISVLRLRNLTKDHATLDPRDLRGEWLAATFQHVRLAPIGSDADTTCVYLISERPFAVAMAPFIKL